MNEQILQILVQFAPYIVGAFMPFVISYVTKDTTSRLSKFVITALTCIVAGVITNAVEIFDGGDWWETALKIFAASQGIYQLWFKNSVVEARIQGTQPPATN